MLKWYEKMKNDQKLPVTYTMVWAEQWVFVEHQWINSHRRNRCLTTTAQIDAHRVYDVHVHIQCSKNRIKQQSQAKPIRSFNSNFRLRVENMTDLFLFLNFVSFSRRYLPLYGVMQSVPLTMGQNVEYTHSIKCHFSSPSSSFFFSLCLRIVEKCRTNKYVWVCECVCVDVKRQFYRFIWQ